MILQTQTQYDYASYHLPSKRGPCLYLMAFHMEISSALLEPADSLERDTPFTPQ